MSSKRGQTKAEIILAEARQRLDVARQNVQTAEGQLGIANAMLNAHQAAYDALDRTLMQTRKKRASKGSPATSKLPLEEVKGTQ